MYSWNCCRACLGVESLQPIFPIPEHHEKYSELIFSATGLKVDINDALPQEMCSSCIIFINNSCKFRNNCKENHKALLLQLTDKETCEVKLEAVKVKTENPTETIDLTCLTNPKTQDNSEIYINNDVNAKNNSNDADHDSTLDHDTILIKTCNDDEDLVINFGTHTETYNDSKDFNINGTNNRFVETSNNDFNHDTANREMEYEIHVQKDEAVEHFEAKPSKQVVKKPVRQALVSKKKNKNKKKNVKEQTECKYCQKILNTSSLKRHYRVHKELRGFSEANLSMDTREDIIELHQNGRNISQISEILRVGRHTVSLWIKRFKEEGHVRTRKRAGRPRIIDATQRETMINEVKQKGFIGTRDFADKFNTSLVNVRRAFRAVGLKLHSRKPIKKRFLSEKNKQLRLNFAREYLDIELDWNTVIFSDKKVFKFNKKDSTDEQNDLSDESCKISVHMWAWMSAAGPGELEFIPPKATSNNYVDVLNDIMLPTVRNVYPTEDLSEIHYVQENCPIHRATIVRSWFYERPDIKPIPWPARSPDLNPMEDLWSLMVERWDTQNEMSLERLKSHCVEVWESLRGTDVCSNIVGSMRRRLLECIENNGGYPSSLRYSLIPSSE